jgi:exonuclease III
VEGRWDEVTENALLLRLAIAGETYIIGSIYGPNENNVPFYQSLKSKLEEWNVGKIVLGGDWNCLFSSDPVQHNLDCINMANLPNPNNTLEIIEMCRTLNLTDPFRFIYPDRRDFSYTPRNVNKNNRSRLDFFIISENLIPCVNRCQIESALQNSLFDH